MKIRQMSQHALVNLPPSAAKSAELNRRADEAIRELSAANKRLIESCDRVIAGLQKQH